MNTQLKLKVKWTLLVGLLALAACTGGGISVAGDQRGSNCSPKDTSCNVLGGYSGNSVASGVVVATIAGGGHVGAPNRVTASEGTVGGGEANTAGEGSTVAGGSANTALYFRATVGGGSSNLAAAEEATVGGGLKNSAIGRFSLVGGGGTNLASADFSTVSGGSGNSSTWQFATVGGGTDNRAENEAAVVSGGLHNLATGSYSAVLGGVNNLSEGSGSTVAGGAGNTALGSYSVVPGGFSNQAAGDYSFAAGRGASVNTDHPGVFLFADAINFPFTSIAPNEFAVRSTGGVRFVTSVDSSGKPLAGVRLSPGSGSWESLSDVNSKAGFAQVDGRQVLDALMTVPLSTWYYRGQGPTIRHIGPLAQDFYSAFHFGTDNRYISTVDEEGVALAAIQELYRLVGQGMFQGNSTQVSNDARVASLQRQLYASNVLSVAAVLTSILALWRRKKVNA